MIRNHRKEVEDTTSTLSTVGTLFTTLGAAVVVVPGIPVITTVVCAPVLLFFGIGSLISLATGDTKSSYDS